MFVFYKTDSRMFMNTNFRLGCSKFLYLIFKLNEMSIINSPGSKENKFVLIDLIMRAVSFVRVELGVQFVIEWAGLLQVSIIERVNAVQSA